MENGWIKLHRKLLENPISKRSTYFHLWITLLLKANHEEKKMIWNGDIIVIKEGQMITGRKTLSEETGIPQSTIEDILRYLETQHQIRQQKNTKFRLITIVKWEEHQQRPTANPTTSRQQADTNKNDKKDKKNTVADATKEFSFKESLERLKDSERKDHKIIALYWKKKGWEFQNQEQFNSALKRELKPASMLKGYSGEQIAQAIGHCEKNYKEWGLETCVKRITDLTNKK